MLEIRIRHRRVLAHDVHAADLAVVGGVDDLDHGEAGLRVELLDLVRGALHVSRTDAEALGDLTPAVIDQLFEAVADETIRYGLLEAGLAKLQHEALSQVAGADAWRVETLNDPEHLLDFRKRVERQILELGIDLLGDLADRFVDANEDIVQWTRKITVLIHVPDELFGEQLLTR